MPESLPDSPPDSVDSPPDSPPESTESAPVVSVCLASTADGSITVSPVPLEHDWKALSGCYDWEAQLSNLGPA